MPGPLLRKVILDAFPQGGMELCVKQAIDWVALQVHELTGADLASRLKLNCTPFTVGPIALDQCRVTIIESNGETMVPEELRRQLRGVYPDAWIAQLKSGGDFPYLSRPDEATLFIEVHMRGTGVFAGGSVPTYKEEACTVPARPRAIEPETTGDERIPEAPIRRPIWKNPFEDDPLL